MGNNNSSENNSSLLLNNNRSSTSVNSDYSIIISDREVNTRDEPIYLEHRDLELEKNDFSRRREEAHYLLKKLLFQCEFSSPIKEKLIKGGKVLDLGCGAACFLLDIAEMYPNSKFIGVDIDPVYPKEEVYENLKFIRTDFFKGLPFPDNEFDLVNVGSMVFSITPEQLNFLIGEMIRVCKPDCYIEFDETHVSHLSRGIGVNFSRFLYGFKLVVKSHGADNDMALNLSNLLSANPDTASVDVVNRKLILGPNGGNLGMMICRVYDWFDNSNESFVKDICKQLNITKEQYNQLLEDIAKEITYTYPEVTFIRVYAQKKLMN